MDIAKIAAYAKFKKDVDARAAKVKLDRKKLEEDGKEILVMFTEAGITSMNVAGYPVYLSETIWASAPDMEDTFDEKGKPVKDYARACKALKEMGLGDFVKEGFNSQSISAEIRRMNESDEGIPEHLEKNLKISSKYSVNVGARK